jgi:DNA-binding MarR family transcriptional regulator
MGLTFELRAYTLNHVKDTRFVDCQHCLCLAARTAARGITSVYDEALRSYGLRATQFTTLATLIARGAMPLVSLAKSLGMDRTTMTRNLALLESKGWTQTRIDEDDARTHLISVTAKGRALAQKAVPAWESAQARIASKFGAADVAALHRLASTAIS